MRLFIRIIVVFAVIASFFGAVRFWFSREEAAFRRHIYEAAISGPVGENESDLVPAALGDDDVMLVIGQGSYTMPFTDDERPPIEVTVPVGRDVLFGISIGNGKAIDPETVRVIVSGSAGEQQLPIAEERRENRTDYASAYVPGKPGEYLVSAGIDGTGYGGKMKVIAYDASLISDTSLSAKDISADFSKLGVDSDAVRTVPAHKGESSAGGPFWDIDDPGHLEASFGDEKSGKGVLKLYRPASYRGLAALPEFYGHIAGLDAFLSGKELSKQEKSGLVAFPPINAALGGFSHEKMFSVGDIEGWRYIHHGSYQAVDFPNRIKYIFQGLSKDRRSYVYFEREVRSAELEKLKQETKSCLPDDEKNSCISKAFSILQDADDFDPSIAALDDFVKTISVKK